VAVPHTVNGVRLRARGQTTTSVSDPFFLREGPYEDWVDGRGARMENS